MLMLTKRPVQEILLMLMLKLWLSTWQDLFCQRPCDAPGSFLDYDKNPLTSEALSIDLLGQKTTIVKMVSSIELPSLADFHVHARQGDMLKTVAKSIEQGGSGVAYCMPNLIPPLTSPEESLAYQKELENLVSSHIHIYVTLYLSPKITVDDISRAAKLGIKGVKSYPQGVTTNSDAGVTDYEVFYPIFKQMEAESLVLNIHGEHPSSSILDAERDFLPTLHKIHKAFPKLRIVLEHCTTADAIEAVLQCGPQVAGTITAHHLFLTIDDVPSNPFNFCKPVAKTKRDREALVKAATSANPKFFLGSDSAPHPSSSKLSGKAPAGVFTQPYLAIYLAQAFEKVGSLDKLRNFACVFGRKFYGLALSDLDKDSIRLLKKSSKIDRSWGDEKNEITPFLAEEQVDWSLEWI